MNFVGRMLKWSLSGSPRPLLPKCPILEMLRSFEWLAAE